MPKVSPKRQVTLPAKQCDALGINPGDEVEFFEANGHLSIVKKVSGSAQGMLAHIKANPEMTDDQSLQGNFE